MRVLLVDDSNQLTEGVRIELQDDRELQVTYAIDPSAAKRTLQAEAFDVVVVDVLYEHLTRVFLQRQREHRVSLRSDKAFHVSGLATIYEAERLSHRPGVVLWAIGMENRELHMLFAHQELSVRAYSSKGPTARGIKDLKDAIRAAANRLPYNDPLLETYLPRDEMPLLRDTFFGRDIWRGIWRALALGAHRHDQIGTMLSYSPKTIRNVMSEMAHRLSELDPGIDPNGDPSTVLSTYAARNWQFFLDDTVLRVFPPKVAAGLR
jgi:DNA-binding NarL/FixJ family response regulator